MRIYSRREALRLAAGIGAIAGAGGVGIGCGDGDSSEATATPPAVGPRGTPPSGEPSGRLRLGVVRESNFGSQPLSRVEHLLVYSRLVAVDPRDATVHADLATAFEVIEPLEVRFALRPVAFLHADVDDLAVPVTAELIQRNFEELAADESSSFAAVIERVEAPDANTLVVRLRAPYSLLFELLAGPEAGIHGDNRYASFIEPVGSGPFVPAGQDSTGHALVANTRYLDAGYPRLERVDVLRFADEGELDGGFLASQLDVRQHPDALSVDRVQDRPGTQQMTRHARTLRGLGLSLLPNKGGLPTMHVEAFQDERVRRAVSISLDRTTLAALGGGRVASPVGAAHAADSLPAAELAAHPLYVYDPIEAAKLLEAVGLDAIEFRILASDSVGPRAYAELVESQLREVGFDAQLRLEPHDTWESAFFAGDFESTLFEVGGLNTPDLGLRLHTTGGLSGRFSLWGYSNPVFDSAVNSALSELMPDHRAAAFREAQRLLLEEAPGMFPLVTPVEVASLGQRVRGYAFDAFDFNAGWLAPGWERPT